MKAVASTSTLAVALLALAGTAGAQQPAQQAAQPSACDVNQNSPKELATATFRLTQLAAVAKPEDRAKTLRDVVKSLTEKKIDNVDGKNLLLGQALVAWSEQPGIGQTVKRGDLGFTTDKDATVDVLAAADTAFTAVETAKPGCKAQVATYRQQKAWLDLVNGALGALNANQLDSAQALATRSLVISRAAPYAYHVLANVAKAKKDMAAAKTNWAKVVETAGSDTVYNDVRRNAFVNLGLAAQEAAAAASGAEKTAKAQEAAKYYQRYLAEAGQSPDAPAVQAQLAQVLALTGDTAAVKAAYQDQLANPTKYNDIALAQAGVNAARANNAADAAKLFELALADNPNQRDALYNLGSTLYDSGQYDEMLPLIKRLLVVDPSNPQNYLLAAYAHQGLMKSTKAAKAKKLHTDSLLYYKEKSEKMPVAVTITSFQRLAAKTTLEGQIQHKGAAPKTYQVKVEFLDKAGNVVATQETSVGPVAKGETKSFSVSVDKGGIVAFRYAPLC
jgi:tetratricopeptide (TPR) repeat protein